MKGDNPLNDKGMPLCDWRITELQDDRRRKKMQAIILAAGRGTRVGSVAAFVDWHRLDLLIEAFASLKPKENVRLVLVGDGPALPAAKAHAERLGCLDRLGRGADGRPESGAAAGAATGGARRQAS
jgi:glycosyltransferase involved in cell wall biosynthesis